MLVSVWCFAWLLSRIGQPFVLRRTAGQPSAVLRLSRPGRFLPLTAGLVAGGKGECSSPRLHEAWLLPREARSCRMVRTRSVKGKNRLNFGFHPRENVILPRFGLTKGKNCAILGFQQAFIHTLARLFFLYIARVANCSLFCQLKCLPVQHYSVTLNSRGKIYTTNLFNY